MIKIFDDDHVYSGAQKKMMSSSEVADLRNAGEDINSELRIETHKLDTFENGGVNLQCVNSSEFMVGKQTNFNGPVTIINCTDGSEQEGIRERVPGKEEVVIKDRIMNPTVAGTVEKFVKKKAQEKVESEKDNKYGNKGVLYRNFLKVPIFVWIILVLIILAGLATILTELFLVDVGDEKASFITVNGKKFQFVTKREWGGQIAKSVARLNLPVPYIVISHSGTKSCYSKSECSTYVLNMQMDNINDKDFPDIKYNLLVGGDGLIYEGRGWHFRSEIEGKANNQNINIAFIGNFVMYPPTESQTNAVKALIDYASAMNYTVENYHLIPASLASATKSPGKFVIDIIKDWPHYTNKWP